MSAIATNHKHEHAMGEATRLITNLLRCVLFLVKNDVRIVGFRGWNSDAGVDCVVVQVAAEPRLYRIFSGECSWQKRRQEGARLIFT